MRLQGVNSSGPARGDFLRYEAVPDLLPYQELLCACVATGRRGPAPGAPAVSDIDWQAFLVHGVRHGVAQHCGPVLGALASETLPADVLPRLHALTRENGKRNRVLFAHASRLLADFQRDGIPCLVLKGVALSTTVYDDPALRPFADIDLLVDDEGFERACAVAERHGFRREGAQPHARQPVASYVAKTSQDILSGTMVPDLDPAVTPEILQRDGRLVKLEIHRSVLRYASGFSRDEDVSPLWENPQSARLPDGTPFQTLSPEAMLVHLCRHAAEHGFQRLMFPLDCLRVIDTHRATFDWDRVRDLAARTGVQSDVHAMLGLLTAGFGLELPDGAPAALAGVTRAHVFRAMGWSKRELFWRQLRASRLRDALAILRQMLFPPPAVLEEIHGARPWPVVALLYLYRPIHLLLHFGQVLLAPLARKNQAAFTKGSRTA
jgi:hypothetical protein